jgi:hypothetical protein
MDQRPRHDLGLARGAEVVPAPLQCGPQLAVVVDVAVEGDHDQRSPVLLDDEGLSAALLAITSSRAEPLRTLR